MALIRDLFTTSVNSTVMSINERFTYLQKNIRPVQPTVMTIRADNTARQQASAKNRRLAMQMERRLSEMAALKIKKKSIRQRLGIPMITAGQGNNVRDRLTLPVGGRTRLRNEGKKNKRIRGRSLRRNQTMQSLTGGNLQRSRSVQSLNNDMAVPHRSRSRSRMRNRTPSVGPKENIARRRRSASGLRGNLKRSNSGFLRQQPFPPQRRKRSNSINFRNMRAKNLGNVKDQKKSIFKRGGANSRFQAQRIRRGSFRGISGRGRDGWTRNIRSGRKQNAEIPTKEELDKELEQYMANTRSQLDKDIDTYMKESAEATEMWD